MRFTFASTIAAAFVAATLAAPGAALADSSYTKDDVVNFFVKSADLGASRGICIGTEEECAPKKEPIGLDMLINFELASADLTPEAKRSLEVFVSALQDDRLAAARFVVEGHTDASGSDAYNEDLARRRAASVVAFITARGIERDKLVPIGMGERAPRAADPFDPENRRVEMRIRVQ